MSEECASQFDVWLSDTLQKINPDVDLEVFVTYLRGVMETETDDEDTDESILDILREITDEGLEDHCRMIKKKWDELNKAALEEKKKETTNFDQQLASIIEKTSLTTVKQKELSPEEYARKAAILAQYGEIPDEEGSDEEEGAVGGSGGGHGDPLVKISNTEAVALQERKQRERSKEEAIQKKAKDKEDREKQKQKAQERKEKEKARTQKGERRR